MKEINQIFTNTSNQFSNQAPTSGALTSCAAEDREKVL